MSLLQRASPWWALACLLIVGLSAEAHAYPQWQLSQGAVRCNQCHFSPAGGGLITGYGRDAAGDDLSTFRGEGAFLHGAATLPGWLAVGDDLRGALLAHDVQNPDGPTVAAFPMQADVLARVAVGAGFSVQVTGGLRGRVRREADIVPMQNYQPISTSRFVSREHFVAWQPEPKGAYVRAGRFYAPFGLRLAEHIVYVRRDLGFGQLEETYNLSAGWLEDAWEAHVTAFVPDVLRHIGGRETGAAAYAERRVANQTGAVGAQLRFGAADGMNRLTAGGVGKLFLPSLHTMLLGELNVVHQMFDDGAVGSHDQLVGAAGFAVFPVRGVMLTVLGERNQWDVDVRRSAYDAATVLLNWFPYPHFELQLMGRSQWPSGGEAARTFMAQLHYYL